VDLNRLARALLVLGIGAPAVLAVGARAESPGLTVIGHDSLGGRGMNAALAVAGRCAYVGSRNDAPVQVVDISAPAAPRVVRSLSGHAGATPRELRVVPSEHLLVVLYYRLSGNGRNGYDVYHWGSDCADPGLVGQWDFGAESPHEFYLWQDPANSARVLLYTTMFASTGQELQVIDLTVPAHPTRPGGWAVPAAYGRAPVHSVALSADGRTAYISLWTGGLLLADVGAFADGRASPKVRPLTSPAAVFKTSPGTVHSAVRLDSGARLLVTDERYPAPFGPGCPFGPAHLVDISDTAHPTAVATLSVPENTPATCAAVERGTWTSHNATVSAHLALISWYSAGLQVFQLDQPPGRARVAEYRPGGVAPAQRDLELGTTDTMTWSYPVIQDGLIFVVDINQGLVVVRYSGPHAEELAGTRFLEGNSNIAIGVAPAAPLASPRAASPVPAQRPSPPAGKGAALFWAVGLVTALALAAVGLVLYRTSQAAHS
jgi:hypothetical protein